MVRNRKWWRIGLLAMIAVAFVFTFAPTQALAKTGWVKQSNGKYRYYETDSYYYSDAVYQIKDKWYAFDKNGYRQKGWYEDKYTWTDESGAKQSSSTWYYCGEKNDAASVGWKKIGGKWYWFNDGSEDGSTLPYMVSNGSRLIDGKYYLFNKSGELFTNGWYKSVLTYGSETYTSWYWADSNGVCPSGWKKISGTWYYFYDYGRMASNTVVRDGSKFYGITDSGALTGAGWFKVRWQDPNYEYHTYWFYAGSGGVLKHGWQKVGGYWYFFENGKSSSGEAFSPMMYSDGLYEIGKKQYYFNSGGDMLTGWKKISNKWYYFGSDGAMVKGKWVGNYYLKADGTMAVNEWVDGGKYHVDKNGVYDKKK